MIRGDAFAPSGAPTSRLNWIQRALTITLLLLPLPLHAAEAPHKTPLNIGLTPVFLDYQASFVDDWRLYLERRLGHPVNFVQRANYREIVNLLRDGTLDFAWLCGYPYMRNQKELKLVAVPLYQNEPLYRSYLIAPATDKQTRSLADLRWKNFAFSDPDSNSGHLYIEYLLAKQDTTPAAFFGRTFFTWSHRKVIEAVAAGLAQGGSVDGYVWDTLALSHPELTGKTRIIAASEQFGYPPFVAGRSASPQQIDALRKTLLEMQTDAEGKRLLGIFNLNGFALGDDNLYQGIEEMSRFVEQRKP